MGYYCADNSADPVTDSPIAHQPDEVHDEFKYNACTLEPYLPSKMLYFHSCLLTAEVSCESAQTCTVY